MKPISNNAVSIAILITAIITISAIFATVVLKSTERALETQTTVKLACYKAAATNPEIQCAGINKR